MFLEVLMTMSLSLLDYLKSNQVDYQVVPHPHSSRSYQSSILAHIEAQKLAKGILLKNNDDYLLAVLPANRRVDMHAIRDEFGNQIRMVSEKEVGSCFPDCEVGAVPPFGSVYGFTTVVDNHLMQEDSVYFEAGDHETLVKVSKADFESLLSKAKFSNISQAWD
jgi:Ala-tRNA(Pro) deacylase